MDHEKEPNKLASPLTVTDDGFYKKLLDNLHDAVYFVDSDRRIIYWNRAAERLTGYAAKEVVGRHCFDNILVHTDENGCNLCLNGCPLLTSIQRRVPTDNEIYLRHRQGHRVAVQVHTMPIEGDDGQVVGAVEVFTDNAWKIAAQRRTRRFEQMAYLDPVTGLGNRRYGEKMLRARLSEHERYGWSFGLILGDLDRFKSVNDLYGHQIGDAILQMVGRTLEQSLRPFDFTCRWGGDEFVCIVENVTREELNLLAERCRAQVAQSRLPAEQGEHGVTISLGATLVRERDTIDYILARADQDLYQVKEARSASAAEN